MNWNYFELWGWAVYVEWDRREGVYTWVPSRYSYYSGNEYKWGRLTLQVANLRRPPVPPSDDLATP